MESGRYFPGEQPELRDKLDRYLAALSESLGEQPWAPRVAFLLLAGGYGRGEGGVFRSGPEAPAELYNDLEFYLALRDPSAAGPAARWCAEESHRGEEAIGIEVEFKILPLASLRSAGPSMFYYDLLASSRLIRGAAEEVAALPGRLRDPALVPAHEATRLLFNRGSGLYFCQRSADGAFIERNHAKLRLALADAVLALNGRYHFSCRERHARLGEALAHTPPGWPRLQEWHASAVEFKFHPRLEDLSREALAARQQELTAVWLEVFLWLESIRLRRLFQTAREYAENPGRLLPEFPPARNWLLHLRDRLRRGHPPRGWLDYPRAALQRALVLLLAGAPGAAHPLALAASATPEQIEAAYRHWWRFYN